MKFSKYKVTWVAKGSKSFSGRSSAYCDSNRTLKIYSKGHHFCHEENPSINLTDKKLTKILNNS